MASRPMCMNCPQYDHYHKGCRQNRCTRIEDYRARKQTEKDYRRNCAFFADYAVYMAYWRSLRLNND